MPPSLTRRRLIAATAALPFAPCALAAIDWPAIERAARGQTVYLNAWAGSERINAYLQWTRDEAQQRWGIRLEHVKISDTAEVVKRVRAEKQAGRVTQGSVDAVWINGENFLAMKREGLLYGPFADSLPSFANVDTVGKPSTRIDFSEPVDGMEAPWGMAQLTFFADSKRVPHPPRSMAELVDFARRHPGRFTYPKPPNFHGTTFLKQVLLERSADRTPFYAPVVAERFAHLTAPLWSTLDSVHPSLWRHGRQFPATNSDMRQMMADGELLITLTFNPNEAANEIAAGRLPETVISWQHTAGTIGNTHFLAIPFNARAKEASQVLINFLLSPLAQARKADIRTWGDPTVLAVDRLPPADKVLFAQGTMAGSVVQTAPALLEPHATWVDAIEQEWTRRYGQ
jgi:putative thiamine transport system substrate-binding protein